MKDYQADGFVKGFNSKALAEANRQLASAKNATPESQRERYASSIRYLRKDGGYLWVWFRKF